MENTTENEEALLCFHTKRKKAVGWICTILVGIFAIIVLGIYINGRSSQDLYVGESVNAIVILGNNGERMTFEDIDSDRVVVFYVDKKCSPCVNEIPSINLLCKSLEKSDFKPMVLWRKDYPSEYVIKSNEMFSYRTVSSELSSFTPCFFVIEDGKVVFKTEKINKIVEKLLYSGDKEQFRENALENISEEFNMENKEYYLAFCDDETDVSTIESVYRDKFLITVSNCNEDAMVFDPENVLAKFLDITDYPTVVSISKEYEVLINGQ